MNDKLKENIKNIYNDKNLTSDQLDNLFAIQDKKEVKSRSKFSNIFSMQIFALFSVLLISFVSLRTFKNKVNIEEAIIQEIAYNHNKQMSPELLSADLASVQGHLKSLNFSLVDSSKLKHLTLVGGRYCSIQGKVAAQLKYKASAAGTSTVYQTVMPKGLKDKQFNNYEGDYQGVHVKIWHEKGILFGVATSGN